MSRARRARPTGVPGNADTTTQHGSGGAYRPHQIAMLALAAVAFFSSAPGQSFLISVFVDELIADTGVPRAWFSALYAAGTVVSAVVMLGLGRVVDRRGLRVAWCAVALLLAAACGLASVAAGAVLVFLALALLRTSGQGAFTLLGTLLVARSFERRRGQAMAIANLGVTLASVALPPLVAVLIVAIGWRESYRVIALVVLLVVLPLAWFVRVGPPRGSDENATDQEGGAVEFPAAVHRTRRGRPDLPSRLAARLLLVLAAPPLIGTAVTFHATSILAERGIGFVAAGGAVGILGAAAAVGVISVGLFIDRLRTRTTLVVLAGTQLVATLVLLLPSATAAYVAFAILGLGMGGVGVVNGTVWVRTFGKAELGRIQGRAQSSMIASAAIAPLVPALALTISGSYGPGLVLLAVVAAAALVTAATVPRRL